MIVYLEFFAFVLVALLTGLTSSQIAKALDFGMDYGHWLDWFRVDRVKAAAKKIGELQAFTKELDERKKIGDFNDRLHMIDELYWTVALKRKSLTLWLCAKCLSHRINFFLSLGIIAGVWFEVGFSLELLGFYLLSLTFNQIFVSI